ncbi:MAG: YncE family protein [Chitinophagales bacterium]|nr:YncE family protein [Chitinophagales bacterium]
MAKYLIAACMVLLVLQSCRKDKSAQANLSNYPEQVGKIINTQCAISGCHNQNSKAAAGGLSLETWNQLFEGGSSGSVVIPYRPDQSWLMYFVNTDTSRGIALTPTMPVNAAPLSDDDYYTLYNWILSGAPDANGTIAFSGDPDRKKFYVSNEGCDLLTVFDTKTLLAMRYIDVGILSGIEVPHQLKISPDGQYLYACFVAGTIIQKLSTAGDSIVGQISIGPGSWNTMAISSDGKKAFAVDFSDEGKIAYINLDEMKLVQYYQGNGLFESPHGSWLNSDFTTLYVTAQYGNFIYKIDITNPSFPQIDKVVLKPGQQPNTLQGTIDPHEVLLSPDESKYFVTCQASNEVRVMDTKTDTLITVLPVGRYPVEMVMSKTEPYLFVTCMEDPCSEPVCKGSIYVINYENLTVIKSLQSGLFEPHGIAVDDEEKIVMVANRNVNPGGPAPHHVSECGGRNGFMKFINLETLEFLPDVRPEISVDPYSVAAKTH